MDPKLFRTVILVLCLALGAGFINPYIKAYVTSRHELKYAPHYVMTEQTGWFADTRPRAGDLLVLSSLAHYATFVNIEIEYVFFNSNNSIVDRRRHRVTGPLEPQGQIEYQAPRAIEHLFRNRYTITVLKAETQGLSLWN